MEMLTGTWFWAKGILYTTFWKSTKALEAVDDESFVLL
jgi:hypothetical protein